MADIKALLKDFSKNAIDLPLNFYPLGMRPLRALPGDMLYIFWPRKSRKPGSGAQLIARAIILEFPCFNGVHCARINQMEIACLAFHLKPIVRPGFSGFQYLSKSDSISFLQTFAH